MAHINRNLFNSKPFNDPLVAASKLPFKVLLFSDTEAIMGELDVALCELTESEVLQSESTLDLTYPMSANDSDLLKTAFSIAIPDMDYGWNIYDIQTIEEDVVNSRYKVYAENRFMDLLTEPIKTISFSSATPQDAINAILSGTRWTLRYLNITSERTWGIVDVNPLNAIRTAESIYGGYLKFTVSISETGIDFFNVDFLSRLGSITNLEFDLSHNLSNITITTDKTNIVTALYGRGPVQNRNPDTEAEEKLTFTDILWDTGAGSPANKPVGQDWVGDETAKALYGKPDGLGGKKHIFGIHESQAVTDASLLQNTWEVLQRNNAPKVNVKASVVDLEQVSGFEHEKVRMGDTVRVRVPEISQYLSTEVIKMERDRLRPEDTRLEFGNFRQTIADSVNELADKTNTIFNKQGIYDRAGLFEKEIVDTEIVYSIDGVLIGENATFSGTVEAATINGGTINGSEINGTNIIGGTITLEGSDALYPMVINDSIDDGSTDYGSRAVRINTSAGAALSCFMGRISDAGVLWLRDTVDPTNNNITISAGSGMATVKDLYARNNVSALSFTDRTPFFQGDALAEIKKIKGVKGEIDHGTLPDFARVKKQAAKIKKVKGKDVEIFEEVEERDLGAMISILTVGIQQLTERLEKLEKK